MIQKQVTQIGRNEITDEDVTSDLDVLGEDQMVRKYIYLNV